MTHVMNCAAFDDRLAAYLEGDLGAAELEAVQRHVASCVRCTALVRDLERIRSGAGELPELTPSRDLWAAIADRIEAPVVPIAVRATPNVVRERRGDRLRLAAVAAALVAVTAGVTYTLTARRGATAGVQTVVQSPVDSTSRDSAQRTCRYSETWSGMTARRPHRSSRRARSPRKRFATPRQPPRIRVRSIGCAPSSCKTGRCSTHEPPRSSRPTSR